MFSLPNNCIQAFIEHKNMLQNIFNAMNDPDLSNVALLLLGLLRETNNIPCPSKEIKSESASTMFRNSGNHAYSQNQYQKALILYNKALLYAPKNSRSMKLAYSNRSALLYKAKAYDECISDIDTCFAMSCPIDIIKKLNKRKDDAKRHLREVNLEKQAHFSPSMKDFVKFGFKCNPDIPSASSDITVALKKNEHKVVADSDVKVGTILAIEEAFVSQSCLSNMQISCYYCHKLALNLIPCEGCCYALFCNEHCRKLCMREFHTFECPLMEVLEMIASYEPPARLALKAFLKMKHELFYWNNVIEESMILGADRLKESTVDEIYSPNQGLSLLAVKEERHFLHAAKYKAGLISAIIIHYLATLPGFSPLCCQQEDGYQAVARLLMFLQLYSNPVLMQLCASVLKPGKIDVHNEVNYGWFPFIGKLKHSCTPNVLKFSLNKEMVLVALQPIKKGTELTVSYVAHWRDADTAGSKNPKMERQCHMLRMFGFICNCIICSEDYKCEKHSLTEVQMKKLNQLKEQCKLIVSNEPEMYTKYSEMLSLINDAMFSAEYDDVYRLFRQNLIYLQDVASKNVILDYLKPEDF